jgi:hypothetical protein
MYAINLRCIDGLDADELCSGTFDGQNWTLSAEKLLAEKRSQNGT